MGDQGKYVGSEKERVERILDRIDKAALVIESLGRAVKLLTIELDAKDRIINDLRGALKAERGN